MNAFLRLPIVFLIRVYQAVHGSFFHGVCRFHPTCSNYAIEAIETRDLSSGLEGEVELTQRLNDALSRRIRALPERWIWMHPRWR